MNVQSTFTLQGYYYTDTIFKILLPSMMQTEECTESDEDVNEGEYHISNNRRVYYASKEFSKRECGDIQSHAAFIVQCHTLLVIR